MLTLNWVKLNGDMTFKTDQTSFNLHYACNLNAVVRWEIYYGICVLKNCSHNMTLWCKIEVLWMKQVSHVLEHRCANC